MKTKTNSIANSIELTDKQRARKLAQAVKYLYKAQDCIGDSVGHLSYFNQLAHNIYCLAVDLESDVNFLAGKGSDNLYR
jgi:hypothetical protein